MKRLIVSLVMLLPVSLFVAGCGGGGGGSATQGEPPSKEKQEQMVKEQMERMKKANIPIPGENKPVTPKK